MLAEDSFHQYQKSIAEAPLWVMENFILKITDPDADMYWFVILDQNLKRLMIEKHKS